MAEEAAGSAASVPRAATQQDVADLAGVNRATVSRALDPSRRHLLAPETVRRVTEAAHLLRYRPHSLAQGLRRRRSGIVGLAMPRALADQSPGLISGAEDRLRRAGFALLVSFESTTAAFDSSRGLVDGAVVVTDRVVAERHPAAGAGQPAGPIVRIGLEPSALADVTIDHRTGIAIAVAHLRRLGHRRIALLCEPETTAAGQRHRAAFTEAIVARPCAPAVTGLVRSFQPRRPASAMESCLWLLHRSDRPTAIVVTDDAAAVGCYGAARTLDLRVPRDVSIVGYGDSDTAPYLAPPLTSIAVPGQAAGRKAAEILLRRLAGEPTQPRILQPYLVQRSSTCPPA